MSASPDVVIVGGGVIGCAVAYRLAREGVAVTLLERGEIAGEASGAAAGMLTPVAEATGPGPLLRFGLRSRAAFPALVAELIERSGIDPELEPSGSLRVAADAGEEAQLRERAVRFAGQGLRWLTSDELRLAEPAAAPHLRGALLDPADAHVRPPLMARALAGAAAQQGARVETGTPVTGLRREGGAGGEGARVVGVETPGGVVHAGPVVLCAGSWCREVAAWLGAAAFAPVAPVRGQLVLLSAPPRARLRPIVWGRGAYVVPKRDGSVAVGATEERVGFDRRVTAAAVASLLHEAAGLVPALADAAFLGAFAGLRPETPDHLPLIGPVPGAPGLALAAGHFRSGVLLAPATAELVADALLGKGWAEPAFLPERFAPAS